MFRPLYGSICPSQQPKRDRRPRFGPPSTNFGPFGGLSRSYHPQSNAVRADHKCPKRLTLDIHYKRAVAQPAASYHVRPQTPELQRHRKPRRKPDAQCDVAPPKSMCKRPTACRAHSGPVGAFCGCAPRMGRIESAA